MLPHKIEGHSETSFAANVAVERQRKWNQKATEIDRKRMKEREREKVITAKTDKQHKVGIATD